MEVAALLTGRTPHISAVIGSRCNVVNLPSRLGDDFISHPSPVATTKWRPGTIKLGAEWLIVGEDAGQGWDIRQEFYREGESRG